MSNKSEYAAPTYTAVASTEVPYEESYALTATAVDQSSLYVDTPVRTVESQYSGLPEVKNLAWTDTFFDNEDDVIAVFDFDYEKMENFYTSVGWATIGATLLYTPVFIMSLVGLAPCYLRMNVRWNTQAQHVAITRDGIRFVRDKRKSCWGMPCSDQGKSSKTVPFDKITDCDIGEPAGNTCLCIENVLTVVNVDTASSGTEGRKELRISGLKDPHSFKKLVWAMKRSQRGGMAFAQSAPSALQMADRQLQQSGADEDVATLLRDIRDELRQNNDQLQKIRPPAASPPTQAAPATAPEEHQVV